MNKISQREAARLKKRVKELEFYINSQKARWSMDWPSSSAIAGIDMDAATMACVRTARKLKHAVVVVPQEGNRIVFFACDLKS